MAALDEDAIDAMQTVLDLIIPGAEVYMLKHDLAETVELGITVGIVVSTTMSDEQVEDYSDHDWGSVLSQLVAGVRKAAFELSITSSVSKKQLRRLGQQLKQLEDEDRDGE